MKVYNAKENQVCKICSFTFTHNKQGRFTSHIVTQHQLTLNEYLLKYFILLKKSLVSTNYVIKLFLLEEGFQINSVVKNVGQKGHL